MSTSSTGETAGVQQLIDRLKSEGVQEGQQQADAVLAEAKKQAAAILEAARLEAETIQRDALQQADRTTTNGTRALSLASRDTALHLKEQLQHEFRGWIGGLVHERLSTPEFLTDLIRAMALQAVESASGTALSSEQEHATALQLAVGESGATTVESFVKGQAADMFRQGISVQVDRSITQGFRMRIDDREVEVDFTEEAVTAALMRFLAPKFRHLIGSTSAESTDG